MRNYLIGFRFGIIAVEIVLAVARSHNFYSLIFAERYAVFGRADRFGVIDNVFVSARVFHRVPFRDAVLVYRNDGRCKFNRIGFDCGREITFGNDFRTVFANKTVIRDFRLIAFSYAA